jgi:hydrogenase maturation factor
VNSHLKKTAQTFTTRTQKRHNTQPLATNPLSGLSVSVLFIYAPGCPVCEKIAQNVAQAFSLSKLISNIFG